MYNKRPKWPGNIRSNILRSLEAARKSGIHGKLKALYKKYGMTPQHEAQWIRSRNAIKVVEVD
jgi:hypothetical protein